MVRLFTFALPVLITLTSCRTEVRTVENGDVEVDAPPVSVMPSHANPGDSVEIRAQGFPAEMEVVVGFGLPQSEYDVINEGRTSDRGEYAASVVVPGWADPGRDYVWVVAGPQNRPLAVSDRFTIGAEGDQVDASHVIRGVITDEGVECRAMRDDDGALYTLANAPEWAVPGTRVVVRGSVAEMSFCQQGTTISVADIQRE